MVSRIQATEAFRTGGTGVRLPRASVCRVLILGDPSGRARRFSDIAKAYESDEGEMVILTKEDLASLPVEQSHEIEVTEFVPADQVDPVAFDNAYFLESASRSNRAYVLMREALESTDRLAICTFTLRNRTRLCALRVYKDVLMLQTLLWPDEIRPAILEGLDKEAKVRPQEVKMAASLIETMAADFEPEKYEDDYQNQLKEFIEAKAAGGEAFTVEEREDASDDDGDDEVADLLAALRASVKDRGGDADDSDDEENLSPPAVGYPGGGSGFNVGGVDVGSKALDFEALRSSARTDVAPHLGTPRCTRWRERRRIAQKTRAAGR